MNVTGYNEFLVIICYDLEILALFWSSHCIVLIWDKLNNN